MIKNSLNRIIILICTFILCACSNENVLTKAEFLEYFNSPKSKFYKQKTFNNVTYKLKMQLPEYLVLKNISEINSIEKYNSELERYHNTLNFVLLIEDDNNSRQVKQIVYKPDLYSKLTNYTNLQMADEIFLVNEKDTLPCTLVYLEPANTINPVIRLAIGFENIKRTSKEYTVIFNDELFNNGEIKFKYSSETFENLPKLKL